MIILWLFVSACDNFEYSPNQTFDNNTPRDLNKINIEKLQSMPVDDTVTIAFVGDSQRFYDEVDLFIDKVNQYPSVDFVILAGDITDFGLLNEYEWIHEKFEKLHKPYISVIGNHDVIANGEDVFKRMYGPLDFSFVYDHILFVGHNTNGIEYLTRKVPDMDWLTTQMNKTEEQSQTIRHIIGLSHMAPKDKEFQQDLVVPYTGLLKSEPRFLISLHGHVHKHTDGYPYNDGVRYMTSHSFDLRNFIILKVTNGKIIKEIISY